MQKWTRHKKVPVPNTCFSTEISLLNEAMILLEGEPTIVEFGTLLGGLTYAMAAGLNGRGTIHSYDVFEYQPWMNRVGGFDGSNNFRHLTEKNLSCFSNVRLYETNLCGYQKWDQPIDMLVIDAFKDVRIAEVTIPTFFSQLKPGGYLFDQDLGYNPVQFSYMVTTYYQLRDYLIPQYLPWPGTGVLFQLSKQIPIELLNYIICDRFNTCGIDLLNAYKYFVNMDIFNPRRTDACSHKNQVFDNNSAQNSVQFASSQYTRQ